MLSGGTSENSAHRGQFFPTAARWVPRFQPPMAAELYNTEEVGEEGFWHSRARLQGKDREGLLVDIGAHDNLAGDAWLKRVEHIFEKHNLGVTKSEMTDTLVVEGVGAGSQSCTERAHVPMALETGDQATFSTPIIPNSDVPALLGMKTLEAKRAVIDVTGRKLYLLGPGDWKPQLPTGTIELNLEKSESGHLMLPITELASIARSKPQPGASRVPASPGGHHTQSTGNWNANAASQDATTPTAACNAGADGVHQNTTGGGSGRADNATAKHCTKFAKPVEVLQEEVKPPTAEAAHHEESVHAEQMASEGGPTPGSGPPIVAALAAEEGSIQESFPVRESAITVFFVMTRTG